MSGVSTKMLPLLYYIGCGAFKEVNARGEAAKEPLLVPTTKSEHSHD